jgi:hypothetical protein
MESPYYKKYLKYYTKYLELKNKLSLVGHGQTGVTYCSACSQSGECQYRLEDHQIDANFLKEMEIIGNFIREFNIDTSIDISHHNIYLKTICNLEAIIRIHFLPTNSQLWEIFLTYYQYLKDEKECYNVFIAFINEMRTHSINFEPLNALEKIVLEKKENKEPIDSDLNKIEMQKFNIFLNVEMNLLLKNYVDRLYPPQIINDKYINNKMSINDVYIIPELSDEELERILSYLKKRKFDIYTLIGFRNYDLTETELQEFYTYMNEFKLKDIESFSYYGYEPNLRISDIILNIITKFTEEKKKILTSVLTAYPHINIYIGYYLINKKASLEEIKILNKLLDMFKNKETQTTPDLFNEIMIDLLNKIKTVKFKWTGEDLKKIHTIYGFYKSKEEEIKQIYDRLNKTFSYQHIEHLEHEMFKINQSMINAARLAYKLLNGITPLTLEENEIKSRLLLPTTPFSRI